MVFNARAHAKCRATGFYGDPDTEASFYKRHSYFCRPMGPCVRFQTELWPFVKGTAFPGIGKLRLIRPPDDPAMFDVSLLVIVIGRTWSGGAAGDLHGASMRLSQRRGESEASAGDLFSDPVSQSKRRGYGECGAKSVDGDDSRRFRIRTTADGDGLAHSEACHAGDGNYGRACVCGGR